MWDRIGIASSRLGERTWDGSDGADIGDRKNATATWYSEIKIKYVGGCGGNGSDASDATLLLGRSKETCAKGGGLVCMDEFVLVLRAWSSPEVIDTNALNALQKLVDFSTISVGSRRGGDGRGGDDGRGRSGILVGREGKLSC